MSAAARAFKAQAVAAVPGMFDGDGEVSEIFRRGDVTTASRLPA
jgi:hypothetical protein